MIEAMERLLAAIARHTAARAAPVVVALDGRSGTGKSTLAKQLAATVGAVIINCDDFYAGGTDEEWLARTPRDSEPTASSIGDALNTKR
jgi:uridine kinase